MLCFLFMYKHIVRTYAFPVFSVVKKLKISVFALNVAWHCDIVCIESMTCLTSAGGQRIS